MISIIVISKDEESLDGTLTAIRAQAEELDAPSEIVVVDASDGRLVHVREHHEGHVRWVQFESQPGARVSIPHQRNLGVRSARGDIIVFTDAGCEPQPRWLARLVAPLLRDENVACGLALATPGSRRLYDRLATRAVEPAYMTQCSTINLAFRRAAFDAVGGFDEGFAYGSDVDFSWRLTEAGYRIRTVRDSVVLHDWGTWRRQLRRSYFYGKARVRLYRKHRSRRRKLFRDDPMVIVYPTFVLGLPLILLFPLYPAVLLYPVLLLIPAWRNRADGPFSVIVDHLVFGVGVLAELVGR